MICNMCQYEWASRIDNPKACPRCKRRFDYISIKAAEITALVGGN